MSTLSQLAADVSLRRGNRRPIAGFVIFAATAAWLLARLLRDASRQPPEATAVVLNAITVPVGSPPLRRLLRTEERWRPMPARRSIVGRGVAIAVWISVAVVALFRPDVEATTAGADTAVPVGIPVAVCALLAWFVARYGLGSHRDR